MLLSLYLQRDGTTWEIPLGTRLHVKVVTIFNSHCISVEWSMSFMNSFEIFYSAYILLSWFTYQQHSSLIGYSPVYQAEDLGSRLSHAKFFNYYVHISKCRDYKRNLALSNEETSSSFVSHFLIKIICKSRHNTQHARAVTHTLNYII